MFIENLGLLIPKLKNYDGIFSRLRNWYKLSGKITDVLERIICATQKRMLVSVIITTYNRANMVVEAIKSVQRQTYQNIQIIVIDDGSTDNTRQKVSEFKDVEYYYQKNGRQASARNLGLKYAKGEFIATLDSDDVWNDNFLAESVKCLENNDLDFVFSNWLTKQSDQISPSSLDNSKIHETYTSKISDDWFLLNSQNLREVFTQACPAPASAYLFKRNSIASQWNTELKIADDWCFFLDIVMSKDCRAAFTLKPLWLKNIQLDNIYDGQPVEKILRQLEIFDNRLMKKRLDSVLTSNEKLIFKKRIKKGQLSLVYLFFSKPLKKLLKLLGLR